MVLADAVTFCCREGNWSSLLVCKDLANAVEGTESVDEFDEGFSDYLEENY